MIFTPRTTAPEGTEQWWQTSWSPCITGYGNEASTRGSTIPNCFSGDTEVLTDHGIFPMTELLDKSFKVMSCDGVWRQASVWLFGPQQLVKLHLGDNIYYTTLNHRWVTYPLSKSTPQFITTAELSTGSKIPYAFTHVILYPEDITAVIHGFIYRRGYYDDKTATTSAFLQTNQYEYMNSYFEGAAMYKYDNMIEIAHQLSCGKVMPSINESKQYLYNFLRGYFAADGVVNDTDNTVEIGCISKSALKRIRDICNTLGIRSGNARVAQTWDSLKWAPKYYLALCQSCLDASFFIDPAQRDRFKQIPVTSQPYAVCKGLEYSTRYEPVYCVVEPVTHTFTLGGGELTGNCVGYAFGRFAEIMNSYPEGLPNCNAGDWYDTDTTHEKSSDPYAPKLGAAIVWTKAGAAGHVAIVESIEKDSSGNVVSIVTSESGWQKSWSERFWTSTRQPPNYSTGNYVFKGFIYNPGVKSDASTASPAVSLSDPNHPARIFIAEAEKHVGPNGHTWVKNNTGIGENAWCAATCVAVARTCGYAGVIMPANDYTASGFGRRIVEEYGGEYLPGPMMGGSSVPQVGDIIEFYKGHATSGTYGAGTRYAAYHVGMVRSADDTTVYTVEGNTSGSYKLMERSLSAGNIGWYARPDWTKVGGAASLTGGGPLYTTKSTNADASIREVCYLDDEGKPSITPTDIKLSVVNYTTLLAAVVEQAGGTATSTGSPDNLDALTQVQRVIVEFFISKGLCTAAGIGIIANIQEESDFDTSAVKNQGASFGLCQWPSSRGTAMKQMVGTDWANNLTGQLNYLWYELNTAEFNSSVLVPLQNVANTLDGAKSAAEAWCRNFERPDNVDTEVETRKTNAENFWKQVVVISTSGGTTATNATAQGTITNQSGVKITQGTSVSIPATVSQTGIIANYTGYDRNWASNTIQRTLYDIWVADGKPSSYGIATLKGYYLIALAPKFGTTGDIVSVVLEDNTYFNAVLGDAKGSDAKSEWGHYFGSSVDIVEWESVTTQDTLRSGLSQAGWLNKKVDRIINYGQWLTGSRT